jgi:hypothetical protein
MTIQTYYIILKSIMDLVENWWWIILPFLLWRPFLFFWLWIKREGWLAKQKTIMLELKAPKDVLEPVKAMEEVFSSLWGDLYGFPDPWEKWMEGECPSSYSFEIASIGGSIHFYVRIPESARDSVESAIYSQYPDAEISLAEDYTKLVPKDIPNKDWDLYGTAYKMATDDIIPIKTYPKFFEEKPDIAKEEKRIDPISTLIEGLTRIKKGEQLWLQIIALPITNGENDYVDRGKAFMDKIFKRTKEKPKVKPMIQEGLEGLLFGISEKKEGAKEEKFQPETMLSSEEKQLVSAVGNKISKNAFACTIRFLYLGKKDVFFKAQIKHVFGFMSQFSANNLNGLVPLGSSKTKIKKSWFFPLNYLIPRGLYIRKRKVFRNYIKRLTPYFPKPGGTFVLNTEELATIFHFPSKVSSPTPSIHRVDAKKGEPPPELPV